MNRRGVRAALPLVVFAAARVLAQQAPPPPTASPPASGAQVVLPPRVGIVPGSAAPLSLDDAVRLALEHNSDVIVARLSRETAVQDARAAAGIYDPVFLPTVSWQKTVNASTSTLSGGANGRVEERRAIAGASLQGASPWAGGRFSVDFSATRLESSNQFLRLNPQYPSLFGVSYTQPLLRGFGIDDGRRQILLTRKAVDLSDAQLTRVLMDQLSLVEQAYWDVVYANRNLDVLTTALAQARAQVASNERQVTQGTLAPIDVIEAQTQVSTFEQTVATAQQSLTEAENRLKRLILQNRAAPLWNQAVDTGHPPDRPVPGLTLEQALDLALRQRPELRELDVTIQQNEIDTRYFRDLTRPRADVVGSYTLQGLAGTAVESSNPLRPSVDPAVLDRLNALSLLADLDPVVVPPTSTSPTPPFLVGGLGQSLSNIVAGRLPVALVQLQVEVPLRNRTAQANLARTEIARRQLLAQRDQTELTIETEVRNALQAVESSQERLRAAASAARSAQEQYESEQRRFESGLSTVFLVLQRQTTLVTAQALEVRARADLNQAIAVFDRAVGATLTQHHVALQAASAD